MIIQSIKGFILGTALISLAGCALTDHGENSANVPHQPILLWQGTPMDTAPGSLHDQVLERSKQAAVHDRAWLHVASPAIIPFAAAHPNGCSVILAPGGGYQRVVFDKEGEDMVPQLTDQGYTVFILKYRLPGDGFAHREWVPLQDAQRAIRTIRQHADEWHLNAQCIGIVGFSAGGQLAASLGTQYHQPTYPHFDAADTLSARPDFLGLMYPVISMSKRIGHTGTRTALLGKHPTRHQVRRHSLDKQVTHQTPPTFIGLANDDHSVNPMNSLLFYQALRTHHVQAELHIFQHSGHGFGLRKAKGNAKQWLSLFIGWMQQNHFGTPKA